MKQYDVLVIGGGHAGIEAAAAAARIGVRVGFLTPDPSGIGELSCNPAVGGVAKGHLVREIDALGGLMAHCADQSAISYRTLNQSKGKAVWATRAQVDRLQYPGVSQNALSKMRGIVIVPERVVDLLVNQGRVCGVATHSGKRIKAKAVIVCAGTFLKSTIHIGMHSFSGGRLSEESSDALFASCKKLKLKLKHFKTGTCARLDKRTVDFSCMIEQPPDYETLPFSFFTKATPKRQMSCYITHTNERTHAIIRKNLKYSPLYAGKIKSTGVRYCPSLEDKVVKFADRSQHQVFIEPEGRKTIALYPNGISTSLPFDVQLEFIHTIKGLEHARILRPGYGIEHGVLDPRQLDATLETTKIKGLFFAGQVNGTTGYEEAAAQGLIAGLNAALAVRRKKPFMLHREESFIGVLLDDLTRKGVDEPYRMFTSRCEFRLSVRESNAAFRLSEYGRKLGLISTTQLEAVRRKKELIAKEVVRLRSTKVVVAGKKITAADWLKRPRIDYARVAAQDKAPVKDKLVAIETEIQIKYEGFLHREKIWHKELKNLDRIKIPSVNFTSIPSLSREVVEKLEKFKPRTFGDALRITGVTPAAILAIYQHVKKKKR